MVKGLIQKFFGFFGLQVSRLNRSRKYLPKPTVENIEIVVRLLSLLGKEFTLIQIGACDGVTSDSVYPYIKSGNINAYLIEPSKTNFKKLQEFYTEVKNVTLINAAISDSNESRILYSIKDEGRWKDNAWARQLASFYKEHLLKHGIHEQEILADKTECLTLKSVIAKYKINSFDILLVDTEGYDGEIIKMAIRDGVLPPFIVFENAQLVQTYSQTELDNLYKLLAEQGYVWTHDRINTLAIRSDFFKKHA